MYEDVNIISVDDNSVNLLLIEALAKDLGIPVKSFTSAKNALDHIAENTVDVILTDYMMPEMHGVDFIRIVRKTYTDLPIVMITAVADDNKLKIDALEAGATEFLNKPLNPTEFKARLLNLVKLRKAQLLLKDRAALLEDEVRKSVRVIEAREHEALSVLGRAAEYKDIDTAYHINRVSGYSTILLRGTGASLHDLELIFFSAPLHDIGKIGIPDVILLKPAAYTPEEFEIMKKHPRIGYHMLKDAKSQYLRQGAQIAISHHEKYNGRGYPNGLGGKDIPLVGRIVAIADVFDALTTVRPYKKAWPLEKALELVKNESGEHFDPELVTIFFDSLNDIMDVKDIQSETPMGFNDFANYFKLR